MRDLGSHLNLAKRAVGTTLSSRLAKAIPLARAVGSLPVQPSRGQQLAKMKVLPFALYGVEATPIPKAKMARLRAAM
eukprot:9008188-Alexandrium_andersonii.AAC.1